MLLLFFKEVRNAADAHKALMSAHTEYRELYKFNSREITFLEFYVDEINSKW
jgi:hypothetical protein